MKRKATKAAANENGRARAWAKMLNEDYHHWHRGAFGYTGGCRVIFGNDGYRTDRSGRAKEEVRLVKERLKALGIVVRGFGVSPGGYSWVIIVNYHRTKVLDRMVWDAWFEACERSTVQRKQLRTAG